MESLLRRATFIVNPSARGVSTSFDPRRPVRYLERRGVATVLEVPGSPAGVTLAAAAAAERGADLVFVLGGDGTLRDAANGLAGSNTALAALPGGTVNIWVREMGIPRRLRAAIDAHLHGQRVRADLGLADRRRFLLMASAGWDALAAHAVSPRLKRVAGDLAYIASFARLLPRLRYQPIRWRTGIATDDHRMAMIVISNTRLYGGRVHFTPEACATDGLLDVAAVCPQGILAALRVGVRVAADRIATDRSVIALRTPELAIETPGIPLQLDGDYAGETPARFSVEARALAVSVPPGPLPPVLAC
jgi:diacylglycerol kinase (ATP)